MEEDIQNYNREKYESLSEDSFFNRTEYSLLLEYALTDGYKEYSKQETKSNNGLITTVTSVVQGFFVDDNRTRAIISDVANLQLIPEKISNQIQNLIPIDHIYEGYEYLLVKSRVLSRLNSMITNDLASTSKARVSILKLLSANSDFINSRFSRAFKFFSTNC